MLGRDAVIELVRDQLWPLYREERERHEWIDLWCRWQQEDLSLPHGSTAEHRRLGELAKTPWLGLVVTTIAQAMYVDGYRSPQQTDNAGPWETWEANNFDARQVAVHRTALGYGTAYVKVTPGADYEGRPRARMRGVSPKQMLAVYADPAEDEWPLYAMQVLPNGDQYRLHVFDEDAEHILDAGLAGEDLTYLEPRPHGIGVPPVIRYAHTDLDGRSPGEVEPLIGLAERINKTTYDRLLTQHFNSWKIRTIAGIDLTQGPSGDEGADEAKLRLRQSDLLTAKDPNTKFGTLDETSLDPFLNAYYSDIETLASLGQVPTTSLTGKVANLSADAIAELRSGLTQKVTEYQKIFGNAHAQSLRLAAHIEKDDAAASDFRSRITWQDAQIRSLSQAVDALGKAAQMLGVPPEALWGRIPGVEKADVDEWQAIADRAATRGTVDALAAAAEQVRQRTTTEPMSGEPG